LQHDCTHSHFHGRSNGARAPVVGWGLVARCSTATAACAGSAVYCSALEAFPVHGVSNGARGPG
jgi:hypothetical protein